MPPLSSTQLLLQRSHSAFKQSAQSMLRWCKVWTVHGVNSGTGPRPSEKTWKSGASVYAVGLTASSEVFPGAVSGVLGAATEDSGWRWSGSINNPTALQLTQDAEAASAEDDEEDEEGVNKEWGDVHDIDGGWLVLLESENLKNLTVAVSPLSSDPYRTLGDIAQPK